MTQTNTPATGQTQATGDSREPESAQTTEKPHKYYPKTLEAIQLVNAGVSPEMALKFSNQKDSIRPETVSRFKQKLKKHSLTQPKLAKNKQVVKKKGRGRPKTDWRQLQTDMCRLIANSNMGWRSVLAELKKTHDKVPHHSTVEDWLLHDKEFAAQYARAKEDQADFLVEEMLQIADDSSQDEIFIECTDGSGQGAKRACNKEFIARSRLRVDTRKFIAAKLKPKKYGDKLDVTSGDKPIEGATVILTPVEAAARIAYLFSVAIENKKKAELLEDNGK
jgi:hypothetical protein